MTRTNADLGRLLLRLVLGGCMLFHGVAKIAGGVAGISQLVASHGLPAFLAYGVYVGEVVAPLLVILGFYSRIGALLIAINMLVAVGLVHMGDLFKLTDSGGWALELQAFYFVTAVALALMGPGRFGVNER